jgi:hypothetical protein
MEKRNDFMSAFFLFGILAMEKRNDFMSAIYIFGILAMERRNDIMSAFFFYLVFWQWKNEMTSSLHFTFGILAMEK